MSDHMSDQEFLSRLRDTAFDAAGDSTLDVDSVLRSSRRKHAVRRAGYAAAAGIALSTAGFGAAGALPGVPGLWDEGPVQVSPSSSISADGDTVGAEPATDPAPQPADPSAPQEKTAQVEQVGPGVWQVTEPVTVMADADTAVVDLGLGAWGDDRRFLAEVDLATEGGTTVWKALRIVAGTDQDLRTMARGGTAGTLLWDGVTNDAMVQRADGGASLVFGLTSGVTSGAQHLVLDEPLDGADPSTASVEVRPFDVLGDGSVWLRVAEVRSAVEPRGFVFADGTRWGASWCRATSPECTVTYDPAGGTVGRPAGAELTDLVTQVAQAMTDSDDRPVVTGMEVCVSLRGDTTWTAPAGLTEDTLGEVPAGVDASRWRQCLIDLTEAAIAVQQGLITPSGEGSEPGTSGDASPTPTAPEGATPEPSDSPGAIETVTDGIGQILDGVVDGIGDATGVLGGDDSGG